MEIIFIGTGSGKVVLNRYHSSFILKSKNFNLLVEAGDSVSRAIADAAIDVEMIDAVFITHAHADHFCGLPSLITQMKMNGRTSPLKIIVHQTLIDTVKQLLRHCYIFDERLGFEIIYMPVKNSEKIFVAESLGFITMQNSHLDKYIPFNSELKLSLSSQSVLFFSDDKTIFYTGDIGGVKDLELFAEEKIDYLICETSHITAAELNEYINYAKPVKTFLTHIDDSDFNLHFSSFISGQGNVVAVEDGMKFQIPAGK